MTKKVLIGLIILGFVGFLIWIQGRNTSMAEKKIEYLMNEGKLTEGTITGKNCNRSGNSTNVSTLMYEFCVENKRYTDYLGSIVAKTKSKESTKAWHNVSQISDGANYVVLYDPQDISNSVLCLDYPIDDTTDLEYWREKIF